jgi:4-amino-4-deoxy-L-arabinose transferase-like glycosyltransferase
MPDPPLAPPDRADAEGLRWLWPGLLLGAALRLLCALVSAPTPGDDVGRLVRACRWSEHPEWLGLFGVWPPLWTYTLGTLTRMGGDPHTWARVLGWVSTTAALPFFFLTIRDLYGDARRAGLATLLLALYYVHIWMAGTAYTEAPYTCVLFASLLCVVRAPRRSGPARSRLLLAGGLALALAMLFRHEARLVGLLAAVWLFLQVGPGGALRYAIPSLVLLAWDLVDPSRRGGGFADDARVVAELKLAEVALHGSRLEALGRWVIMPAGSPSAVVMALGAAGLWMSRQAWRRDLWAWLFVVQTTVFLALTIYPGWQPYLRYLFLYVVCLLPHAALALDVIARRRRWAAVALVVLAMGIQAVAWSRGRNEDRPLGWLPVYRAAAQQAVLDAWVSRHAAEDRVLVLEGYPRSWDVYDSVIRMGRCDLLAHFRSVSYDERMRIARGGRLDVGGFDVVLLNPSAGEFPRVRESLPPGHQVEHRDDRLMIVRLVP